MRSEHNTTKILKNNKEMEMCIRRLINIAKKENLEKNELQRAINLIWNKDSGNVNLTKDEAKFMEKVTKFVSYYRPELVKLCEFRVVLEGESIKSFKKEKKSIFDEIVTASITTLYILYQREIAITEDSFERYMKKIFKINARYYFDKRTMKAFFFELKFEDNKIPYFSKKFWEDNSENDIFSQKEYWRFANKYKMKFYGYTECALMAVWFINKYF